MPANNRLLDDLAKLASGALHSAAALKDEIDALIRQRVERLAMRMDLVGREEFEAVKAVAEEARAAQIKLERRLAALEARPDAGGREP